MGLRKLNSLRIASWSLTGDQSIDSWSPSRAALPALAHSQMRCASGPASATLSMDYHIFTPTLELLNVEKMRTSIAVDKSGCQGKDPHLGQYRFLIYKKNAF
jgi:hypothetical protein